MFEFIRINNPKNSGRKAYVRVKGISDTKSNAWKYNGKIFVYLNLDKACNIVLNERIADIFRNNIALINIPMKLISDDVKTIESYDSKNIYILKDEEYYFLNFNFRYAIDRWKRSYSIFEIVTALKHVGNKKGLMFRTRMPGLTVGDFSFYKKLNYYNAQSKFRDEAQEFMNVVREVFEEAYKLVDSKEV